MIKKTMILLCSLLVIQGCKVKRAQRELLKVKEQIEVKTSVKKDSSKSVKEDVKEIKKVDQKEVKQIDESNVEIKGKVNKENPLEFYNIKDGDTLSLIKITGIADVLYKSNQSNVNNSNFADNYSTSETSKKEEVKSNTEESSLVDKATEVQKKTVAVVKRDFTIGSYIVFLVWGLVIIGVILFATWFRKTTWWTKITGIFKFNKKG